MQTYLLALQCLAGDAWLAALTRIFQLLKSHRSAFWASPFALLVERAFLLLHLDFTPPAIHRSPNKSPRRNSIRPISSVNRDVTV